MLFRNAKVRRSDIQRFWSRVDIRSRTECWEWLAGRNSKKPKFNYGIFWLNGEGVLSHRLALALHLKRDIWEQEVMHTCDNPPCCNPYHLFAGTHTDNMQDKIKKGRHGCERGEDRYNAKLSEEKVRKIRKLHRLSLKYRKYNYTYLAKMFDVDRALIRGVVIGTCWKHVRD